MKYWFNHNDRIFWVVERVKRKAGFKQTKVVAYYSIVPLTKTATKLVLNEELPGTDFTTEHIARDREVAHAYYIGGIAATGFRARGAVLSYLKAKALELEDVSLKKGIPPLFLTRPVNRVGLRLVGQHDFTPANSNVTSPMGRVHRLDGFGYAPSPQQRGCHKPYGSSSSSRPAVVSESTVSHQRKTVMKENSTSIGGEPSSLEPTRQKKWDLFVCHASEDKKDFVTPLAIALQQKGIDVWYDEFSIKWGDSIRRSIEKGLQSCKFGIVVFSHSFFRKEWPQNELDALYQRMAAGEARILPIWHGIDETDLRAYSPLLSGILAKKSDYGIEALSTEIEARLLEIA